MKEFNDHLAIINSYIIIAITIIIITRVCILILAGI